MNRIWKSLTYGNVVATLAVFLAMGGAAYAVTKAPKNSVTSESIRNGAVTGKDVRDDSLSGNDIEEASLTLPRGDGTARPVGPAGGDLAGTYPNPKLADNAVNSEKVTDGTLTGADVKDDSLTGADVEQDSLGGGDVQESTLSEVPAATLGGIGRYGFEGACNPESEEYVPCSTVTVNLPNPARLLVIGTAMAHAESGSSRGGDGYCRIGTTSGPVEASQDFVRVTDDLLYGNLTVMAVTSVFPAGAHTFGIDCLEAAGSTSGIEFPQARVTAVALSAN